MLLVPFCRWENWGLKRWNVAYRGLAEIWLVELDPACHHDTREKDEHFIKFIIFLKLRIAALFFLSLAKELKAVTSFLLSCNKTPRRHMFSAVWMQYCCSIVLGMNCSFSRSMTQPSHQEIFPLETSWSQIIEKWRGVT